MKNKTPRDNYWQRYGTKTIIWLALPVAIIGGYFYPILGFAVLICMFASIIVAFKFGRAWCDVCPRGSFFDIVMQKLSPGKSLPKFFRINIFRIAVLAFMMGSMAFGLWQHWGNYPAMGLVFVNLLAFTTIVGIVLAFVYRPRSWCAFCPMGSMANWIGKKEMPLQINSTHCVDCGLCAKACPMEINPASAAAKESGMVCNGDCIKCSRCVIVCNKKALHF
ncbi:MAG: 4Fe-4S binding protein [bacterium]